ncbi:biotin--[acetyl-CoA-carboxylase] ligase [Falsirhodobacter algicola]|uniref:biotin--[biotin carboxyl-carrier protein] ligase n=1 Tax=Falsirhodobacter algicola TaxID=2692330 RepID=A0A8J8MRN7_9RHOB|nr:biotin--[acetyl-CoA-carboxylase] ligase [Falsirhodobacter algicola]QUS35507.1 biotin--[acetyl-CoA-carboxylase] ligase [Falsirhodobacter algicola]
MSADWPEAVDRHLLPTVDSTNTYGFLLPRVPAWVVAEEQTAGRGRRGRNWVSPRGNFYGSLILEPDLPPERTALLSFAAALALRDACVAVTGMEGIFRLKWPNDVLLNGRKLSGILLERRHDRLAIGMGVNLIGAPPAEAVETRALPPTSLLEETGQRITPAQLLSHLAPAMQRWQAELAQGFGPVRKAFLSSCAHLGAPITARTMTEVHEGIFEGIDDSGALELRTSTGIMLIPAADIFFRNTPDAPYH